MLKNIIDELSHKVADEYSKNIIFPIKNNTEYIAITELNHAIKRSFRFSFGFVIFLLLYILFQIPDGFTCVTKLCNVFVFSGFEMQQAIIHAIVVIPTVKK